MKHDHGCSHQRPSVALLSSPRSPRRSATCVPTRSFGDIDLFLVVGGRTTTSERWLVGLIFKHHDQQLQELMNALMSDGTPCVLCGCRDTEDVLREMYAVHSQAHRPVPYPTPPSTWSPYRGVSISSSLHASTRTRISSYPDST
jgi:hypothetical protein